MKMTDMSVRKYSSASRGQASTLRRISMARDKQKHVDIEMAEAIAQLD